MTDIVSLARCGTPIQRGGIVGGFSDIGGFSDMGGFSDIGGFSLSDGFASALHVSEMCFTSETSIRD